MAKETRLVPHEIERDVDGKPKFARFRLPEEWQRRYGLEEDAYIHFGPLAWTEVRYRLAGKDGHEGPLFGLFPDAYDFRFRKETEATPGRTLEWVIRRDHRRRIREAREAEARSAAEKKAAANAKRAARRAEARKAARA